jgi:hypothetical protein
MSCKAPLLEESQPTTEPFAFPTFHIKTIDESDIHKYFGDSSQLGSGYVLFYQARDLDMSNIIPLQWAQQQASVMKSPVTPTGLGPADLDQYGGLLPHTQQQELIHQQLASRQQQQSGGGGFGSFFGNGSITSSTGSANGPRSPTQIHDPNMLNGQKITSGSYVYTNGVATATSSPGQPAYASTNGYHPNGMLPEALPSPSSSSSPYSTFINQNGPTSPQSPTTAQPSSLTLSKSSTVSANTPHTTIDPAKLKRTQSTSRISLAAAKSFGASGGKSFIGSFGRSGNGS